MEPTRPRTAGWLGRLAPLVPRHGPLGHWAAGRTPRRLGHLPPRGEDLGRVDIRVLFVPAPPTDESAAAPVGRLGVPTDVALSRRVLISAVLEGTVVDVTRELEQLGEQARPDPGRAQCDLGLAEQGGICAIDDELGRAHS